MFLEVLVVLVCAGRGGSSLAIGFHFADAPIINISCNLNLDRCHVIPMAPHAQMLYKILSAGYLSRQCCQLRRLCCPSRGRWLCWDRSYNLRTFRWHLTNFEARIGMFPSWFPFMSTIHSFSSYHFRVFKWPLQFFWPLYPCAY